MTDGSEFSHTLGREATVVTALRGQFHLPDAVNGNRSRYVTSPKTRYPSCPSQKTDSELKSVACERYLRT